MKLAISNIAWDPADDDTVSGMLRHEGLQGIELAPTVRWAKPLEISPEEARAYREWWTSRDLQIVAMQSLLFGRPDLQLFGNEESRRDLLVYLGRIFELGTWLGARAMVFGAPKNRQRGALPAEHAIEIAIEFFDAAARRAEEYDVVLCLEPNPSDYGCDFITTTAQALELVRHVGRPGLRVQGDMGALTLAGEGPSVLAEAAPHIGHFHISEPYLAEPGTGDADHAVAASALRQGGYQGWLSIEMRKATNGSPTDAILRAVRLTKRAYF